MYRALKLDAQLEQSLEYRWASFRHYLTIWFLNFITQNMYCSPISNIHRKWRFKTRKKAFNLRMVNHLLLRTIYVSCLGLINFVFMFSDLRKTSPNSKWKKWHEVQNQVVEANIIANCRTDYCKLPNFVHLIKTWTQSMQQTVDNFW